MTMKIGILVGSLRAHSYNRMVANTIPDLVPTAQFEHIAIGELPFYNSDLDQDEGPDAVKLFRDQVRAADGIIIVSPEYNAGMPGVLKNALDWASTKAAAGALIKKPAAIIGATPGPRGTIMGQQQIRHTLEGVQALALPYQRMYISEVMHKVDPAVGKLTDATTNKYLQRYVEAFVQWIDQVNLLDR
ncbi:chromate reductase [Paenibacillus phyllosphaerae]|uniref:Chromate reductase n=1 Tax=Paenibacillus phyllosphaerae TaxID=274593 RepID=A0A7W5FNQ6_9BACL|nr:NADPH-dependent FMN reductase [Paenibacillus phyllosphaerae]MBB3111565.1 chromate reductase [Paenibacillus phyllosphaerae]